MKTTLLAALVAMALAGCGEGDLRAASQAAVPGDASADFWAEQAFGIYGESAVRVCIAGFHAEFQASPHASASNYRAALAEYMCACARGQSDVPCPEP